MSRLFLFLMGVIVATSLVIAGCSQAAPPAPTQAPAKPAEPTKAAAPAAPTTAPAAAPAPTKAPEPAKKVDWPQKGKTITVIVPYAAGGATHNAALVLAAQMEKELGTTVQVVNRPGAAAQVGITELAQSKPDGYTLGYTVLPTAITIYLDPERKSVFGRKDIQTIAGQYSLPYVVSVQASSPYQTFKDLIDAAKANPGKLKAGTTGAMGMGHLGVLQLEKTANVDFSIVNFDGGGPQMTALLGGHIDVGTNVVPEALSPAKAGQIRALAFLSKEPNKFFPDVKTAESMGFKVYVEAIGGISGPAGMPKEVVDVLSAAAKKAMATDEHKKKMDELGFTLQALDPAGFAAVWDEQEAQVKPLLELAKADVK